jgi:hypothetical protein
MFMYTYIHIFINLYTVMKEAKTVPVEETDDTLPEDTDMMMGLVPPPLAGDYWTDLNAATFRVRGPTYLQVSIFLLFKSKIRCICIT